MSYKAIVARVSVAPHPNADRLQVGTVLGETVIVGLNVKDGDLGLYFPAGGQLSNEFCELNDLYPRLDADGGKLNAGYIDPQRRDIRAIKLRGVKSYGLWMPVSCLRLLYDKWEAAGGTTGEDWYLEDGQQLAEFYGTPLCCKYESPATKRAKERTAREPKASREHPMLPQHKDTENWARNRDIVARKEGAVFTVTHKLHGTSQRSAHVVIEDKPGWLRRLVIKLFGLQPRRRTDLVHGTRRVPKGERFNEGYRDRAAALFNNLPVGWAAYYEIVGYEREGVPIMQRVSPKQVSKEFAKRWGDSMTYTYGCEDGESDVYLYRILVTNEDGSQLELSYDQIVTWANKQGIKVVPVVGVNASIEQVDIKVANNTDGPDTIDPSHIREGVVIRVDHAGHTQFYKNKSHDFLVMEGVAKADVVDVEDAS